ncbi:MAG: GntR family transcriptional regulator [Gemmiger sp.]|nr:GntR family transcriptional regulator [Gemmiger sp.]
MARQSKNKGSVVEAVFNGIINAIIEGRLAPGSQLPTETALCEQFAAGRNSVREAIKKLEAYGVVYIRRADGTYVSEHYNQKMLDPILYSLILQKNSWADFVEMRRVMDIGTLHVLVERPRQAADLPALRGALAALEGACAAPKPDPTRIMDCDTAFHRLITGAAHNPQLATITEYVTRLTIPSRLQAVEHWVAKGEMAQFVALHRELLAIIENKQADKIQQAVTDHYIYWQSAGPLPENKEGTAQ